MIKKRILSLWAAHVLSVFLIILLSSLTIFLLALLVVHFDLISLKDRHPVIPILSFLFTSVAIGTFITVLVSRRTLTPITNLIKAIKEVAKGNFNVKLEEVHRIDELEEMARNFNIMVQELNSIETLRTDFVVNVSHELKTPIAAIEGYATLLRETALTPEEHEEYLQMIIESARQLSALSSNILKISKLENQELFAEKDSFRLDEQLRQALLLLEAQWSKNELNLNIELEPVVFRGNEEILMQVWLNLLGNAIKFTPPRGEISLSLTASEDNVTVKIGDTGIGISTEVQKHIFEKFYQGDRSRASEGNGLGLSLVKRIVDLHGGSIKVESQSGVGSLFTVTLPQ
ncbi:sensor histidine kinase [Dehalobacterium formicoaceticum]|uniref:sensor histidine kinase n=1 Tax=Dehalobacterium formicoaceticum TaxID=51515 RepID=UPI000B7C7606|nr:HAMP domain-containing sensor histidine kinase [Dehalobacterium formicoaceticum]